MFLQTVSNNCTPNTSVCTALVTPLPPRHSKSDGTTGTVAMAMAASSSAVTCGWRLLARHMLTAALAQIIEIYKVVPACVTFCLCRWMYRWRERMAHRYTWHHPNVTNTSNGASGRIGATWWEFFPLPPLDDAIMPSGAFVVADSVIGFLRCTVDVAMGF